MSYNYIALPEAEEEAKEAAHWYEQQKRGLGGDFLDSLRSARRSIEQNPATYRTRYKKKVRACVVDRFPYLILYVVEKKDIKVISVFHTARNPQIWKERVK
jgi:plasmid stabilization system protein ParE